MLRIGIDVGGTNTDAVLIEGERVLAWTKTPTTRDTTSGISSALNTLMRDGRVEPSGIQAVMIGTTHFTNAVIERKRLLPTAALRIGLPATGSVRPFAGWRSDLRNQLGGRGILVRGGNEYDGRELAPLDELAVKAAAREMHDNGVRAVAVTSVFSPVSSAIEERAAQILRAEYPDLSITLSHEIGKVGLIERENAAILNASLNELAVTVVDAFQHALSQAGISAPFFISQNDGTLMAADFVRRYPVLTFASGPTNSMRGAAFLSGVSNAVVLDIGGTTSDLGMLVGGFPREATSVVDVGGVRTNFRMPDVLSFGLGGGSIVREEGGSVRVGPDSVGYEITSQALVFGGSVLTATDVAVAAGLADIGDRSRTSGLSSSLIKQALSEIQRIVASGIDRVKTSGADVPVVLVGGGSILVDEKPHGASELLRPEYAGVANAIGAAIAQIGGRVDRVFSLDGLSRESAVEMAKQEASERAIAAGALEGTIEIADIEELPLAYLPGNAVRIRVSAVGTLAGM